MVYYKTSIINYFNENIIVDLSKVMKITLKSK